MTSILSYASSPFCASLRVGSHVRVQGKFWPARKLLFVPNFSKGRKSLSVNRSSGEEGKEKKLFSSSVFSPLHPYASVMIMIIIIYRTPLYWKLAGYVLGANFIPGLFNYRYKMGGTFSRPPIFKGKVPGTKLCWSRSPSRGTTRLFRLSFVPCYDTSLPENFSCSYINSISAFFQPFPALLKAIDVLW